MLMIVLVMLGHMAGAVLLVNSIPHLVKGLVGESFPSPFSKPPGQSLSSPKSNIIWGAINFLCGYGLLFGLGFNLNFGLDSLLVVVSALITGIKLASHFEHLPCLQDGAKADSSASNEE